MILAAHQPNNLPYPGFFNKMMMSDVFVLEDTLQYARHDFHNRNRIRTKVGWRWITVPVFTKGRQGQRIIDVIIDNRTNWGLGHWRRLIQNYTHAPYFKNYESFFERLYSQKWERLEELNRTLILYLLKELGINTRIQSSSDIGVSGKKTDFLVNLCLKLGADTYLSGLGGKEYLEEQKIIDNGIKLVYQEYQPISYRQCFEPFVPDMSIIDMLFNHGSDRSEDIILNSSKGLRPKLNLTK